MTDAPFLNGGGKAGALIREADWERSVLGPPEKWPPTLRVLVDIMLRSEHAMLIAWGPSLIAIYNDAHSRLIGDKHPATLGQPLFETWADVSSGIEPLFRQALGGKPTYREQIVIPIRRSGRAVAAHFSISYTPVPDGDRIGGVLCLSTETTDTVIADRRKAILFELSDQLRAIDGSKDIVAAAVDFLGRHLQASRVGYGEVQGDEKTILLETSYVDGVAPLQGLFDLESFGHDNVERQRRGETVAHDDVAATESVDPVGWSAIETRSFASVPLIREGRLRASLYVNFREPHAWASEEIGLLEEVAARIWDSLERARAEEALRRSEARFRAAVEAVQGILWTNNAAGKMEGEQAGWAKLTGQAREVYQGYGWA